MKRLILFFVIAFGFSGVMFSQIKIKIDEDDKENSKLITEIFGMPIEEYSSKFGNVGAVDLTYLFGDEKMKEQSVMFYGMSIKPKNVNEGFLAAYRILELSRLENGLYGQHVAGRYSVAAESFIEKCKRKFGKKDEFYANLTQESFYAKNNIQTLTQLKGKVERIIAMNKGKKANDDVDNKPVTHIADSKTTQNTQQGVEKQEMAMKADVDDNIPCNTQNNDNTFVVIIANENYQDVANVPYTINDGGVFAEYCKKTLGIPETNISFVKDATANNMKREIRWLTQILEQFKGDGKAILYYAGHGIPDESTKDAYLLPIDGYGDDPQSGYSLNELYKTLNSVPSKSTLVFLDACFSGSQRGEGMLSSTRGVAIKSKPAAPVGNMVVFSAASGDETAYPYKAKGHGLFTYFLLKKMQESKGNVTLGELSDYISDQVGKKSIIINRKSQTPTFISSPAMANDWKNMKLR